MSKNKISIIIFVLFLISCTTTTRPSEQDFHIGFNGLAIGFLKNTPPSKVFEEETLPVILNVKNIGAYDIKDNEAVLSLGVEKDYTKRVDLLKEGRVAQLQDTAASFSLAGRSALNQIGDEEVISYNVQAGTLDPQSEYHTTTVIATLCYPYETTLTNTICIDTDINNLRPGKKVCKAQDLVLSKGQGAPVAITKIEVNMLPLLGEQKYEKIKPQFLIYVENKGQGLVIKREAVKDFCTKSDTKHENINIVYVEVLLGDKELECQLEKKEGSAEQGHIKLKAGKDIIRCAVEEGEAIDKYQDPYFSTLKVILKYGYTQSLSANYFIQKSVG